MIICVAVQGPFSSRGGMRTTISCDEVNSSMGVVPYNVARDCDISSRYVVLSFLAVPHAASSQFMVPLTRSLEYL